MKWHSVPTGLHLPMGGHDYNLLDMLLTRTRVYDLTLDNWITIRTTRENIERYRHLWEEDHVGSDQSEQHERDADDR